jgi:hypothetical protein
MPAALLILRAAKIEPLPPAVREWWRRTRKMELRRSSAGQVRQRD